MGKKTKGRLKIKMEYIADKLKRYTTFSKRRSGIMKKAYELHTLTGTDVLLLVASETGHVYTYATEQLKPIFTSEVGRQLIQQCLVRNASANVAPDMNNIHQNLVMNGQDDQDSEIEDDDDESDDQNSDDIAELVGGIEPSIQPQVERKQPQLVKVEPSSSEVHNSMVLESGEPRGKQRRTSSFKQHDFAAPSPSNSSLASSNTLQLAAAAAGNGPLYYLNNTAGSTQASSDDNGVVAGAVQKSAASRRVIPGDGSVLQHNGPQLMASSSEPEISMYGQPIFIDSSGLVMHNQQQQQPSHPSQRPSHSKLPSHSSSSSDNNSGGGISSARTFSK